MLVIWFCIKEINEIVIEILNLVEERREIFNFSNWLADISHYWRILFWKQDETQMGQTLKCCSSIPNDRDGRVCVFKGFSSAIWAKFKL